MESKRCDNQYEKYLRLRQQQIHYFPLRFVWHIFFFCYLPFITLLKNCRWCEHLIGLIALTFCSPLTSFIIWITMGIWVHFGLCSFRNNEHRIMIIWNIISFVCHLFCHHFRNYRTVLIKMVFAQSHCNPSKAS